jgi:hypothetical protein
MAQWDATMYTAAKEISLGPQRSNGGVKVLAYIKLHLREHPIPHVHSQFSGLHQTSHVGTPNDGPPVVTRPKNKGCASIKREDENVALLDLADPDTHESGLRNQYPTVHELGPQHSCQPPKQHLSRDGAEGLLRIRRQGQQWISSENTIPTCLILKPREERLGPLHRATCQDMNNTLLPFCILKEL